MINKKKILISGIVTTALLGICSISASADSLFVGGYEDNNYPFYNVSSISYIMDDIYVSYNIERDQVNHQMNPTGNSRSVLLGEDGINLEIDYQSYEYNEYINLVSTYDLPIAYYEIGKYSISYENFVLKDYHLEEDNYSSLEGNIIELTSSSYFNIESVDVTCYVLEYKFINDEWQIVPVLYDFNVNTYINQETQQEAVNFALIYDELQNYNSRDEYAIRNMVITFNLSYNDTSYTNPILITHMGYVPYDVPIANIYTTLNNQVWLDPIEHDYTSWLVKAVGGFLDTEIVPGFSIGGIFGVVLMIALLSYILKMFLGG